MSDGKDEERGGDVERRKEEWYIFGRKEKPNPKRERKRHSAWVCSVVLLINRCFVVFPRRRCPVVATTTRFSFQTSLRFARILTRELKRLVPANRQNLSESLINSDRQFSTVSSSLRNISYELAENYSIQRCIPVYVATRPNESETIDEWSELFLLLAW